MTELTQARMNEITALERLTLRQLQARHKQLTGKPTKSKSRDSLIGGCVAAIENPPIAALKPKPHKRRRQLDVGTVLSRTHKGQEITVTTTAEGFDWNGTTYTSLSTLAKAIVGYHVSGPAFFKLASK